VAEAGPDSFMERHLLHLPTARSATGSYGSAVHAALETAQRLVNTSQLELDTILDRFEATLRDEHLAPLDYEHYRLRGENLLKRLFTDKLLELRPGGLTEQRLSDIMVGDARLGGKLDRLDEIDKRLLVSDYKTGKPLASFETKDQTKLVKAWRHRTQLLFYALMVQASGRFKYTDLSTQMIYVEADNPKQLQLSYQPGSADLKRLEQLISAAWQRIMALDFPDTSQYSADFGGIQAFEADLLNHEL
jgi:hypothetical protein